jgi:hypothetical protein
MAHKKSKLLQALDKVLDSDELDVIQAKIENDMEADKDELEDERMREEDLTAVMKMMMKIPTPALQSFNLTLPHWLPLSPQSENARINPIVVLHVSSTFCAILHICGI